MRSCCGAHRPSRLARSFKKRFGLPAAGLVVYGDASGSRDENVGIFGLRNYSRVFPGRGRLRCCTGYRARIPAVRERVCAVSGAEKCGGEIWSICGLKCKELIADLEQVSYLEDSTQIDKDKDRRRSIVGRAGVFDLAGEPGNGWRKRSAVVLRTLMNSPIEQEHPDYAFNARSGSESGSLRGRRAIPAMRGGVSDSAAERAGRRLSRTSGTRFLRELYRVDRQIGIWRPLSASNRLST